MQFGRRRDGKSEDRFQDDDEPAWMTANIPSTVAELKSRSGFDNWARTSAADDDKPPF